MKKAVHNLRWWIAGLVFLSTVINYIDRQTLAVLSPVDLAVSKLARFQDQDRQDIMALAQHRLVDGAALQQRANAALDYYVGDARWIQHHLADALALIASC